MANHNEKLFEEFPPVSTEQWEEVIHKDLKGADYSKKLIWRTIEGINAKPYYRQENLEGKEHLDALPGEFPFIRGNKPTSNEWEIRQDIKVGDPKQANEEALFILDRGVTSLGFGVSCKKGNSKIKSSADLKALLNDIHIDCIGLYFNSGHNTPEILEYLAEEVKDRGSDKAKISGAACYDPLGYLTIKGAWGESEQKDFEILKNTIVFADENLPGYRVFSVNGQHFNNAGATIVQELGYSLSMAADYLSKLVSAELSAESVLKHMQLNLGVGTNYFLEIAKIRAARYLFAKLAEAYETKSAKIFINSFTSGWNNTVYDPYVNVLRATTESMAATIGGTDALVVRPFDKAFKKANKISDRIARNLQIILKEESYFDKIVDPSAGSYYIENLTDSIIEESWKLFLDIESKGGYLQALKDSVIQNAIEETSNKRNLNLATRKEILLGTNQFPNFNENVDSAIDKKVVEANKVEIEGSVVKTIVKYRGAEKFEALRLATENHSKRPKVFMLTYGNLTFRKARAAFSCNFFACAGYEVIDNLGFNSAEEGVEAARKAGADIIVICSSDDEYTEFVPKVKEMTGDDTILVVAGAPSCMDDLKSKGIEHFIHVRSNVLESLSSFHKELGIKIN